MEDRIISTRHCVTYKVSQCLTKRKFLAKLLSSQQADLNDSVGLVDLKLDFVGNRAVFAAACSAFLPNRVVVTGLR